jgi:hypothetical protein
MRNPRFLAASLLFMLGCGTAAPAPLSGADATAPPTWSNKPETNLPTGFCSLKPRPPALEPPTIDRATRESSRANLRAWVELFTNPSLKGRFGGSAATQQVAALLAQEFLSLGFSGPPSDLEMCRRFDKGDVSDQNVVAHLKRKGGPAGARPRVIIGAHYDAQGSDERGNIYPGADDNASGVAALLEIARLVAQDPARTGSDLVLIAFGAEERGLLGARAYVQRPTVPLDQVALMINLDMVGRPFFDGSPARNLFGNVDTTIGFALSKRGEEETDRRIRGAARGAGARVIGIPDSMVTIGDHSADSIVFSDANVPTLFLSTSIHEDYHRPTDTAEKIDFAQIERAVRLVLGVIREPFVAPLGAKR